MQDYKKSLEDFNNSINLKADFPDAFYDRGNVYFVKQNYLEAINNYDKAIELAANRSEFYFNRAMAEFSLGFFEDGCADLNYANDLGDKEASGYLKELCK